MEPHTYILDLMYKFNGRTGFGYDPMRGYSIMECHRQNKMSGFPLDYNKFDWLFSLICSHYDNIKLGEYPVMKLPPLVYTNSFYSFLLLDFYNVLNYEDLFNVLYYKVKLNSPQLSILSKSKDLKTLVEKLMEHRDQYIGCDSLFDSLCRGRRSVKRVHHDVDDMEFDFKIMKLE